MGFDDENLERETVEESKEVEPENQEEFENDIEEDTADMFQEVENLKNELEEYKDKLLRTKAEYDNFRKRSEREKLQIYSNATSKAVLNILPIADSLDLAEKAIEGSGEEYKKGLLMVKAQFNEALKKLGVEAFGEVGDEFDPELHNAVSHIDDNDNEKENFISEVFQKGYKLTDKVIRHAMVQVAN